MAPPPPPPPFCLPFGGKKRRPLSPSRTFSEKTYSTHHYGEDARVLPRSSSPGHSLYSRSSESSYTRSDLSRSNSYSPTINSKHGKDDGVEFKTDTESYNVPLALNRAVSPPPKQPKKRGWGVGWVLGKQREKEKQKVEKEVGKDGGVDPGFLGGGGKLLSRKKTLPNTPLPMAPVDEDDDGDYAGPEETESFTGRTMSMSHVSTTRSQRVMPPRLSPIPSEDFQESPRPSKERSPLGPSRSNTQRSGGSGRSGGSSRTAGTGSGSGLGSRSYSHSGSPRSLQQQMFERKPSSRSARSSPPKKPRSPAPSDSQSTLVGSAYERKINDIEEPRERVDTTERLQELRAFMAKDDLDYYIIPSEDAHGSEYVATCDKRRQYISGFTGSAGQSIVSKTSAYLVTDSRYWLQAEDELDENWHLVRAPMPDGYHDWQSFLLERVTEGMRIGIDARMVSWAKASVLNQQLQKRGAKLVFPAQNLVDLIWKSKPARSREHIFVQSRRFAGQDAQSKLDDIRDWIVSQPAAKPNYAKPGPPTDAQKHVATFIASLPNVAWVLNLRGHDIPFNPVFHAYLFVSLDQAVLFVELSKIPDDVQHHLDSIGVECKEYNEVWSFLRKASWGPGKVLISDDTSYAVSLLLTHFRYTIVPSPSFVDSKKAIKNATEIEGLRMAYLRDGASYVKWLAWLDDKLKKGYEITEYEAAQRLTEYRRKNEYFEGLAYENISASGPNAALPHYSPTKSGAIYISRDTPYLNDSGAQYRDGTIDCTRTVHFGRPSPEQCEAFTRVLQGHIAIDAAIFPEGTSGKQLDVLARNALWKDGLNYLHGTGHGFGSFLTVHEGPQGFSSDVALEPGHVLTNEPGFYNDGKWGIRLESCLLVRRCQTKHEFGGNRWLSFERLTCVPIQTRMIKDTMLTKEETAWVKAHNRLCVQKLEPFIRDDKRAMTWLKEEVDKGIGLVGPGPAGIIIDWH